MYINLEDVKNCLSEAEEVSEIPSIFIEYMGKYHEPENITVDDDGDIIIRI